jgi:hypothetical protein
MVVRCKICGGEFGQVNLNHVRKCAKENLDMSINSMGEYDGLDLPEANTKTTKDKVVEVLKTKPTTKPVKEWFESYSFSETNKSTLDPESREARLNDRLKSTMPEEEFDIHRFGRNGNIAPPRDETGKEIHVKVCDLCKQPILDHCVYFPLTEKEYNSLEIREEKRPHCYNCIKYTVERPYVGRFPYRKIDWW